MESFKELMCNLIFCLDTYYNNDMYILKTMWVTKENKLQHLEENTSNTSFTEQKYSSMKQNINIG